MRTQVIVFRQNQFSKMMVVGHHHYLVFLSFVCSGIAFALNGNHQNMQNDVECPKNWTKIGTGCYLFAIPEILSTDNSCKLDGKIFWHCIFKVVVQLHLKEITIFKISWDFFSFSKGAQKKKP